MPPRPARLSTTSFSAVAEYSCCSPRQALPSSSMRSSIWKLPSSTRQRGLRVLQRDVGDEAQPPMVDADQRHAEGRQVARRAQHGAVAAHDHRQRGVLADLFERGGGEFGEPGVARRVGVDQQLPTGLPERERERPQRCVQAGVLVSADQGDGGKVHGCERIRKGDAGKRDTCPEWASLPIIWGRIYACGTKIASIGKDSLKYPPWTTVHARY